MRPAPQSSDNLATINTSWLWSLSIQLFTLSHLYTMGELETRRRRCNEWTLTSLLVFIVGLLLLFHPGVILPLTSLMIAILTITASLECLFYAAWTRQRIWLQIYHECSACEMLFKQIREIPMQSWFIGHLLKSIGLLAAGLGTALLPVCFFLIFLNPPAFWPLTTMFTLLAAAFCLYAIGVLAGSFAEIDMLYGELDDPSLAIRHEHSTLYHDVFHAHTD